jgi:hypothetical protein
MDARCSRSCVCSMVFYNVKLERLHLSYLVRQFLLQNELFMWLESEHRQRHTRSVYESCVTATHSTFSITLNVRLKTRGSPWKIL